MVDNLSPDAFAFVMATGIVSHNMRLANESQLASVLLAIAGLGYVVLLAMTVARAVRCPLRLVDELASPRCGPGFLALVAATGVLGVELAPVDLPVSTIVWPLQALLWLGLTYMFLASVAAHEHKPRLTSGLSGSWLLAVVATQSVAMLGTLVASQFGDGEQHVLFLSLCMFLSACVLYLALIPLIVNRLEFLRLTPGAFTPDYWINMGAMAITTLAGTTLFSAATRSPVLEQLAPFLVGFSLLFWAGATWWIPLLILLEVWRHVLRRVRIEYGTRYWSLVFPVGMYAACTVDLAGPVHLGLLMLVGQWAAYVALALWLLAFSGLVRRLVDRLSTASNRLHRKLHAGPAN